MFCWRWGRIQWMLSRMLTWGGLLLILYLLVHFI